MEETRFRDNRPQPCFTVHGDGRCQKATQATGSQPLASGKGEDSRWAAQAWRGVTWGWTGFFAKASLPMGSCWSRGLSACRELQVPRSTRLSQDMYREHLLTHGVAVVSLPERTVMTEAVLGLRILGFSQSEEPSTSCLISIAAHLGRSAENQQAKPERHKHCMRGFKKGRPWFDPWPWESWSGHRRGGREHLGASCQQRFFFLLCRHPFGVPDRATISVFRAR